MALLFSIQGCTTVVPAYTASFDNTRILKTKKFEPISVSQFKFEAGKDLNHVVSRTYTLQSPYHDSFAEYLKQATKEELTAAGLFRENAPLTLSGTILRNQLHVPSGDATAALEVNFELQREGKTVFQKTIAVDAEWFSVSVGSVAIPMGVDNYLALYKKIIGQLFSDPEFISAATASA